LGDFPLQKCGFSFLPQIVETRLDFLETADEVKILLASDGVWDNFKYGELAQFVQENATLHVEDLVSVIMAKTKQEAFKNFGPHSDNASLIVASVRKD
jgi:serine/threonine protein phosphatase PrpC